MNSSSDDSASDETTQKLKEQSESLQREEPVSFSALPPSINADASIRGSFLRSLLRTSDGIDDDIFPDQMFSQNLFSVFDDTDNEVKKHSPLDIQVVDAVPRTCETRNSYLAPLPISAESSDIEQGDTEILYDVLFEQAFRGREQVSGI